MAFDAITYAAVRAIKVGGTAANGGEGIGTMVLAPYNYSSENYVDTGTTADPVKYPELVGMYPAYLDGVSYGSTNINVDLKIKTPGRWWFGEYQEKKFFKFVNTYFQFHGSVVSTSANDQFFPCTVSSYTSILVGYLGSLMLLSSGTSTSAKIVDLASGSMVDVKNVTLPFTPKLVTFNSGGTSYCLSTTEEIYSSTDLENWVKVGTSPLTGTKSVLVNGGTIIVSSRTGTATSTDNGVTWTVINQTSLARTISGLSTKVGFSAVFYDATNAAYYMTMVVTSRIYMLSSTNGITWTNPSGTYKTFVDTSLSPRPFTAAPFRHSNMVLGSWATAFGGAFIGMSGASLVNDFSLGVSVYNDFWGSGVSFVQGINYSTWYHIGSILGTHQYWADSEYGAFWAIRKITEGTYSISTNTSALQKAFVPMPPASKQYQVLKYINNGTYQCAYNPCQPSGGIDVMEVYHSTDNWTNFTKRQITSNTGSDPYPVGFAANSSSNSLFVGFASRVLNGANGSGFNNCQIQSINMDTGAETASVAKLATAQASPDPSRFAITITLAKPTLAVGTYAFGLSGATPKVIAGGTPIVIDGYSINIVDLNGSMTYVDYQAVIQTSGVMAPYATGLSGIQYGKDGSVYLHVTEKPGTAGQTVSARITTFRMPPMGSTWVNMGSTVIDKFVSTTSGGGSWYAYGDSIIIYAAGVTAYFVSRDCGKSWSKTFSDPTIYPPVNPMAMVADSTSGLRGVPKKAGFLGETETVMPIWCGGTNGSIPYVEAPNAASKWVIRAK